MAERRQKEDSIKELYVTGESQDNPWELRYPLYYDIYKSALTRILERISRWESGQQGAQNCDNIIAFAGERGSGKTTAMIHFCRELENNGEKFKDVYERTEVEQSSVRFYCLETIELSMLEESEDIFELILAKMLARVGEGVKDSRSRAPEFGNKDRDLYLQFEKVYRSYNAVKYKSQMEEYGESPLSRLKNLSSSLSVKEEFAKLLDKFFENVYEEKKEKSILVISFDDLDLNIKYGYEMLETVYRYMRHPKVLVLLAIEPKQMEHICKNHILNAFDIRKASVDRTSEVEKHCEKLARDYLKKMIPLNARMYMPDIKRDFIQVAEQKDSTRRSQKMFLLEKYACKTGIYYDACERKRHFCESDTIRTLTNYVHFLEPLKDVDIYGNLGENEDLDKQAAAFRENYEQIYGDTVNRMALELLSGSNMELFGKLLEEDVSRWGRFVYKRYLEKVNKTEEKSIEEFSRSYSYGDLLESIYYWGRKREKDRPLIHMILALFSLRFTKEYVQYCVEEDGSKHEERLKALKGRSLGGEWTNEGLPMVDSGPGVKPVAYGYIPDVVMGKFLGGNFRLLGKEYKEKAEGKKMPNEDELREVLTQIRKKKMIETLELISLFFNNIRDLSGEHKDFRYQFVCASGKYSAEQGEEYQVLVRYDVDEKVELADFDVWGVAGVIDFDKQMVSLRDDIFIKLKEVLKEKYGEESWETVQAEQYLETLRKEIDQKFPCRKGRLAVPYYNLDLTYNIYKRVRQKCLGENPPEVVSNSECVSYIVKMYQMFKDELQKEADKYEEAGTVGGLKNVVNFFGGNPYILELLDKDKELPKGFDRYIGELVKAIAPFEYIGVEQ